MQSSSPSQPVRTRPRTHTLPLSMPLSLLLSLIMPLIMPLSTRVCRCSRVATTTTITDATTAVSGPLLEELGLSGCGLLEDSALEAACLGCPRLRKLSVSGCGRLKHARLASASLQVLNCQNVERAVVDFAADR